MNRAVNPVENQQEPIPNEGIFSETLHQNALFRDYAHFRTVLNANEAQYRHKFIFAGTQKLIHENQELVNAMKFRMLNIQCSNGRHRENCRRGCYTRLCLRYRSDLNALQITKLKSSHPIDTPCQEIVSVHQCPCRRRSRAVVGQRDELPATNYNS
uniref:FLYWCH-type domain-containing protein n=1 Tax=Panagrellus redivivus TaxID=6233 RepID=A0A7E4VT50_PANRE